MLGKSCSVELNQNIFAESKPNKYVQHDQESHSCNHSDDFNTWYLFFQE